MSQQVVENFGWAMYKGAWQVCGAGGADGKSVKVSRRNGTSQICTLGKALGQCMYGTVYEFEAVVEKKQKKAVVAKAVVKPKIQVQKVAKSESVEVSVDRIYKTLSRYIVNGTGLKYIPHTLQYYGGKREKRVKYAFDEAAKKWNVAISFGKISRRNWYGQYTSGLKKIRMAVDDPHVFYHELSHAAHDVVDLTYRSRTHHDKEVIAETSALILSVLRGEDNNRVRGFTSTYVWRLGVSTKRAVKARLGRNEDMIKQVVVRILKDSNKTSLKGIVV